MKLFKILSGLVLIYFFLLPFNSIASDCKYCCSRSATLQNFLNLHAPTYDADEEKWNKCMQEQMEGESTLSADNPKLKKALEYCKNMEPEIWSQSRWHYMRPVSLLIRLINGLQTEYFRMGGMGSVFGMQISGEHEYFFNGSFEAMINDGSIIDDDSKHSGKPVESRFILELYYNGESEELVKKWMLERPTSTVNAQFRYMILEDDSIMSGDKPIHEKLLWDFEKTPVECDIKPQEKEVFPGQMIDITISNCKGRHGAPSREFQRLVVTTEHGYIANGAPVLDPDYEAFSYGNGNVKIKYQAPGNCNNKEDIISVYNSCDIYNSTRYPLELTEKNQKIGEAKIKIVCEKGFITATRKYTKRVERREFDKDEDGTVNWTSLKKTIETNTVGIRGKLVHYTGMIMPDLSPYSGQYWDSFHVENIEIVSNHAELSEVTNGSGGISTLYKATMGTPGGSKLLWGDKGMLRMIYDKEKKILLDAKIPANIVDTDWTIQYDTVETRKGIVIQEKHTSRNTRKGFTVMRIEEGDIPLEINGSDKYYYGSENERTEIHETLPDDGYVKGFIDQTFDWNISLE